VSRAHDGAMAARSHKSGKAGDFPLFSGTAKQLLGMVVDGIRSVANYEKPGLSLVAIKKQLKDNRDFDDLKLLKKALQKGVDNSTLKTVKPADGVGVMTYQIVGDLFEPPPEDTFEIMKETEGGQKTSHAAVTGDTVCLAYRACLEDGTQFDEGKDLRFIIGEDKDRRGFDQGVIGMKKDGIRTLKLSAKTASRSAALGTWLGFGKNEEASKVPSDVPLLFEITLKIIKPCGVPVPVNATFVYSGKERIYM